MRSASSNSVSTISTNLSQSPSPRPNRDTNIRRPRSASLSISPPPRNSFRHNRRPPLSRSPSPRPRMTDSERKRRRNSGSSVDSYMSEDESASVRDSRERVSSRSTRRKFNQVSPPARGRRTESRSPYRGRRPLSNDRQRVYDRSQDRDRFSNGGPPTRRDTREDTRAPPREKSLSPFSKRLALTQAMNMGR
jgi:hypothetical protein